MKNLVRTTLLPCFATLALAAGTQAATLGLNFVDAWPAPHLTGETADGFNNWTDTRAEWDWTEPSFGTMALAGSSITATWNSANTWPGGDEGTSDQQLYRVYLDDGDAGNSLVACDNIGVSVTISGLSAWLAASGDSSYQIRCYSSTDNGLAFRPVDIRGGAPNSADGVNQLLNLGILDTVNIAALGDGSFPSGTGGGGTRGYGDSLSSLTADVITLTIPSGDVPNSIRGTLAGFKITTLPVPEPGSMALLGLGLGALLVRRSRRD